MTVDNKKGILALQINVEVLQWLEKLIYSNELKIYKTKKNR